RAFMRVLLFFGDQIATLRTGGHHAGRVAMYPTNIVRGPDYAWVRVWRVIVEEENVARQLVVANRRELRHHVVVLVHAVEKCEVDPRKADLRELGHRIAAVKDHITLDHPGVLPKKFPSSTRPIDIANAVPQ